ncbi:hypothetical protein [Bacillus chungangensis]|uniref:Uncharacterized protein n=1 Tax=Bacillus chungangensis TaxID=587633 RepID=A0ABT9WSE6_9BACI|nr:hypothetical protein [Bacillus chungangensis]MDQ0176135.1 hypothetical protein [Bacillus chungangensis]
MSEKSKHIELAELGIPEDIIEKVEKAPTPSVHSSAQGGKGGRAISLTYVDNYSTLLLVYTFLLNLLDRDKHNEKEETALLNESLLSTLQTAMKEQQNYRKSFLDTVSLLNDLKTE